MRNPGWIVSNQQKEEDDGAASKEVAERKEEHCLVAEMEICLVVVVVKAAYCQRDTAKGIERARKIEAEVGWMMLVLNACWKIDEKVGKDFLNTGEVVERWTWGKGKGFHYALAETAEPSSLCPSHA